MLARIVFPLLILSLLFFNSVALAQEKKIITRGAIIERMTERNIGIVTGDGSNPDVATEISPKPLDFPNILFEFNSSKLTKGSIRQLEEIGSALASDELKSMNFEIHGHTDNIGSDEYNLKLSEARASAVRQYLILNWKVDETRLSSKGFGEKMSVGDNNTDEGREKNRRVSLVVGR